MSFFKTIGTFLIISLLTSCGQNSVSSVNNDLKSSVQLNNNEVIGSTIVKGTVEWPASFNAKATIFDIAPHGTVSILYPHDHPTMANKTVATGLTDNNGVFAINPSALFKPQIEDIYVIEVSKRLGGVKKDVLTLRSFIKWTNKGWESMTKPGLLINTKTTALSIISEYQDIPAILTIGTIDLSNGLSVPTDIIEKNTLSLAWAGQLIHNAEPHISKNGIYIAPTDGRYSPRLISTGNLINNSHPIFSTDNNKVLWTGKDNEGNYNIFVRDIFLNLPTIKVSDFNFTKFTSFYPDKIPQFSNDGSKILWQFRLSGKNYIYLLDSSGKTSPIKFSETARLLNMDYNKFIPPMFSSDSSKIVWSAYDNTSNNYHIFVGKVDQLTNPVNISNTLTNHNHLPVFSPDGSKVAWLLWDFTINSYNLYIAKSDGSGTPKLLATKVEGEKPIFSPDGSKIIFSRFNIFDSRNKFFVVNTDGSNSPLLISSKANDQVANYDTSFSQDGNKIMWIEGKYAGANLTNFNIKIKDITSNNQEVTTIPHSEPIPSLQFNLYSGESNYPSFSPDKTKIFYRADNKGLFVRNTDGTRTTLNITKGFYYSESPQFRKGDRFWLTADKVNEVSELVKNVLNDNFDPVQFIDFKDGLYYPIYSEAESIN